MIPSYQFDGRDLLAGLQQLSDRVSRRVQREVLKDAAEPTRARMAQTAPHEPGKPDLRDQMVISNARGQDRREIAIAVGPTRAGFYGSFQEYGTSRHVAQPFARPSFEVTVSAAVGQIASGLWRELAARGVSRRGVSSGPVVGGPGGGLL